MRYATTAPRFAYSRMRVYLMEQVFFVKHFVPDKGR